MTRRAGRMRSRLAWAMWLFTLGGLVGAPVINLLGREGEESIGLPILIAFAVFVLGFATAGALIASRQPSNPVGWLAAGSALFYVFAGLADSFVSSHPAAAADSSVVVRSVIAFGESLWSVGLGLGASLLLLLFPDGRVPGPRWRPVAWLAGAALIVIPLGLVLTPGDIQDYPVRNPLGIPGAAPILEPVVGFALLGLAVSVLLSIASLLFRYRKASIVQRQQLKWLLFAVGLVAVLFSAAVGIEVVGQGSDSAGEISNVLSTAALSSIPIGIGIGILKHRLFDIDVVINRALVYALLTAILGAFYVGIVFGLQALLAPVTAESDLAVAGSTLAVAALFRPVRGRVQDFIDRRFYRRKFDAQRTVEEFNSGLRDEVDLPAISSRLVSVVTDTMQPAHVSLWLRSESP